MDARHAFTLLLIALMILPAVAVAGYRFRRALRERDARTPPPLDGEGEGEE